MGKCAKFYGRQKKVGEFIFPTFGGNFKMHY
ncbi:hypothetical protein Echvi_0033 [Echinicola vietnamensis DSM 17526]|uniref:Uncharacterized protein n=1 Tax=Echinicola vietnamensis (strain DSM 17526 / LMG 23754 / KMM 6221) TaxID=926556 RepID=L0FUA2_ECHVK|nr:hypothetical protein Echvi_0033 [Echinicola vietnamensis DSM 17526]